MAMSLMVNRRFRIWGIRRKALLCNSSQRKSSKYRRKRFPWRVLFRRLQSSDCVPSVSHSLLKMKLPLTARSVFKEYNTLHIRVLIGFRFRNLLQKYRYWRRARGSELSGNLRFLQSLTCCIATVSLMAEAEQWMPGPKRRRIHLVISLFSSYHRVTSTKSEKLQNIKSWS